MIVDSNLSKIGRSVECLSTENYTLKKNAVEALKTNVLNNTLTPNAVAEFLLETGASCSSITSPISAAIINDIIESFRLDVERGTHECLLKNLKVVLIYKMAKLDMDKLRESFARRVSVFLNTHIQNATALVDSGAPICVEKRTNDGHTVRITIDYANDKTIMVETDTFRSMIYSECIRQIGDISNPTYRFIREAIVFMSTIDFDGISYADLDNLFYTENYMNGSRVISMENLIAKTGLDINAVLSLQK